MKTQILQQHLDSLLTTREVCAGFNFISIVTLHAWRRDLGFPAVQIRNTLRPSIRFHQPDVERWARQHGKKFTIRKSRHSDGKQRTASRAA